MDRERGARASWRARSRHFLQEDQAEAIADRVAAIAAWGPILYATTL